ncbi:MAG TPA: DUF2911 domain-containing protein [Ignavibacteriaceae bacterium]|nr:DUF2911 domain-containing protein [Ignavibacteriaceae bacterium]
MYCKFRYLFFLVTFLLLGSISNAQTKDEILAGKMRVSPKASVSETVGFTKISIEYSRPGVKGRKIWGSLVPYNKVWRAGANEATTITFSTNVIVGGKKLLKGTYSFFVIPAKDQWTLIFNKVADQWGAFTYNEAKDAIRVKVKPVANSCWQELLAYTFDKIDVESVGEKNTVFVNLVWEKLKIPFKVTVSTSSK